MNTLVRYDLKDSVATLTMDDGKANALSLPMLNALHEALSQAATDKALVVLTGRAGTFSAGFDLAGLGGGGETARKMLRLGFELSERLLSFPKPVVIACSGHAIAMGVFLLLSGDYRIGVEGAFKIGANEVAIGLPMPLSAVEICRQRLAPAHFSRALITAEFYAPEQALAAGFFEKLVAPADLPAETQAAVVRLSRLNMSAHLATKQRVRGQALQALRAAIEADDAIFAAQFIGKSA